jgi:hypothetical protein
MTRSPFLVYTSRTPGDFLIMLRQPPLQTVLVLIPRLIMHSCVHSTSHPLFTDLPDRLVGVADALLGMYRFASSSSQLCAYVA